jgi:hypothetical protein
MKTLFLASLMALSSASFASLYECKDGDAEPVFKGSSAPVSYAKTSAKLFTDVLAPQIQGANRKPYLIYYVVDSPEPYMQFTVKFEIATLRKACENSLTVNFVAFINSLYVEKNEFVACKNGEYNNFKFSDYPALNKSLKLKTDFIKNGDHTDGELGPMDYLVQYESHINKAFGEFPLAHPDFLHDLLAFSMEHENLFPSVTYMPFLNMKSHGSKENVLSGLLECQVKAKKMAQEDALKLIFSSEELNYLNHADYALDLVKTNELLERTALGISIAQGGSQLGGTNLGGTNLGGTNLGGTNLGGTNLGSTVSGLGDAHNLGSDFSFGLYHSALTAIFSHLFNEETKNILGFAMLEACETKRNFQFHHAYPDNIQGIYSAQYSLWYRNLNWAAIMYEANSSTQRLVELLALYTAQINNIIVSDK